MKILIADDDVMVSRFVSSALKEEGHTCIKATDGQEAVDLAVLEEPDLILMDLNMPIVNGWEAIRAIRRIPRLAQTPIICISGICAGEIKDLTIEDGVNDCMTKPFDIEKLIENINEVSRKREPRA